MVVGGKLKNSMTVRLLVGLVIVLFLASVGYEWYVEGFLPFSPQR